MTMLMWEVTRILTVGHSTRSSEDLVALLVEKGVRHVVDVRRFPGSRRYPHFGGVLLAETLAKSGIEYRHEPDLGGRRTPRPDSPHTGLKNEQLRGFADHMETAPFGRALDRLLETAAAAPTAILCAEKLPWRCHRQLIADALVAAGAEVIHILGPGETTPHVTHTAARVQPDGRIVYG